MAATLTASTARPARTAPPRRRLRSARRGFSLMELLIAIAILLAIGSLVLVNFLPQKEQAERDIMLGQIDSFAQAIDLFRKDLSRFPTEEEGITVLWDKNALEDVELDGPKWKGPYLKTPAPTDKWGTEWVYIFPSEENEAMYEIVSYGPDREESEDDITSFDRFRNEEGELAEDFENFGASDE